MTPARVRRLNLAALWCGFAAALILTLFPPGLTRYTLDGRGFVEWVGEPTSAGKVWGLIQWLMSYVGPLLLVVSFGLQLLAVKKSAPDPPHE